MLTPEVREARRGGVGGSDAAAIMMLNPFRTPYDVFLDKLGAGTPVKPNRNINRGNRQEDVAAAVYVEETGRKIRRHPAMRWCPMKLLFANIDRAIVGNCHDKGPGVLELKCPGFRNFAKIRDEGLPNDYIIQMQHYLNVLGWKWGSFGIYSAEFDELLYFDVDEDLELQTEIVRACVNFWVNHVETRRPPERKEYPEINIPKFEGQVTRMDTDEIREQIERCRQADDIAKDAEDLRKHERAKLVEMVGDNECVGCDNVRIYNRTQQRRTFDKGLFKLNHPDVDLDLYYRYSEPFRTLKYYELKQGS